MGARLSLQELDPTVILSIILRNVNFNFYLIHLRLNIKNLLLEWQHARERERCIIIQWPQPNIHLNAHTHMHYPIT